MANCYNFLVQSAGWESCHLQQDFGIAYYLSKTQTSPLSPHQTLTVKDLLLSNLGKTVRTRNLTILLKLLGFEQWITRFEINTTLSVCVAVWWQMPCSEKKSAKEAEFLWALTGIFCPSGWQGQQVPQHSPQELVLNEDEKKLLAKEGVKLPSKLPLSKVQPLV